MPTYSYKCRKCDHRFQEILSFKEYEEGKRKCPKCGSRSVEQILETFFAKKEGRPLPPVPADFHLNYIYPFAHAGGPVAGGQN